MAQTSMTNFFGGGGKKRSRNDETAASNDKKSNKKSKREGTMNNIVLLTAPGAGGKTSKNALQLTLFRTIDSLWIYSYSSGRILARVMEQVYSVSHTKNMTAGRLECHSACPFPASKQTHLLYFVFY